MLKLRFAVLAISLLLAPGAWAAADDPTMTNLPASISPEEGRAQSVSVNQSLKSLREFGLDLREVLRATYNVYDEVTMKPVNANAEAEDMTAFPSHAQGNAPSVSSEPANRDRLERALSVMRPIISTLKTNVDAFVSGDKALGVRNETRVKIEGDMESWRDSINGLSDELAALEKLSAAATINNNAIADVATQMKANIKQAEEMRRRMYNAIRKANRLY